MHCIILTTQNPLYQSSVPYPSTSARSLVFWDSLLQTFRTRLFFPPKKKKECCFWYEIDGCFMKLVWQWWKDFQHQRPLLDCHGCFPWTKCSKICFLIQGLCQRTKQGGMPKRWRFWQAGMFVVACQKLSRRTWQTLDVKGASSQVAKGYELTIK